MSEEHQNLFAIKRSKNYNKLLRENKNKASPQQKNIEEQRSPTISKASTANRLRLNYNHTYLPLNNFKNINFPLNYTTRLELTL